tara:strand:- start:3598 stop:4110 length:513 start_codon:yes stop_codon:yes gene_type:complete
MSRRTFQVPTFTATATADHATTLASATYLGLSAGGAANRCEITEVYMGGQSAASNVNIMMLARHNTISVTPTALSAPNSDGPMDGLTQAVTTPSLGFVAASTPPTRSATVSNGRLALTYNSFGGIVRWMAAKGDGWMITGVTSLVSESSLSAYTGGGGGVMGAHMIYEQY